MWKIPDGACKTFQSHGPKTTCAQLLNDGKIALFSMLFFNLQQIEIIFDDLGKRICVGYGDGSLKLWDLKNANYMFHVSGKT